MKFKIDNLPTAFAIVLIGWALFLVAINLCGCVKEKTLPVQNGKISVIDTFETDASMKAVPDSLPLIDFIPYQEYGIRAELAEQSGILTIYDPTIKVVYDTLNWEEKYEVIK